MTLLASPPPADQIVGTPPALHEPHREAHREPLRSLLGTLLNLEWPTRAGALLQPFARRLRPAVANAAHRLAQQVGLQSAPLTTVAALERALAAVYQRSTLLPATTPEIVVDIPGVPATLRGHDDPRFRQLAAAARELARGTGTRCVLHGSLATGDWTGYRDADLLLLVDPTTCADAAALRRLRQRMRPLLRALYSFDPLQHHGVFVMPADELQAWPEHFLPVAALQRAVDLGGDGMRLALRPWHDRAAAQTEFDWIVDYFAKATLPHDAYGWKAFASVLMLTPALFLGALGEPVWKGDSFARVRALVPAELWAVQTWAAHLRLHWRDPTPAWVRALVKICPNPRFVVQLGRRAGRPPRDLLPNDGDQLLRETRAFVNYLQRRVDPTRLAQ